MNRHLRGRTRNRFVVPRLEELETRLAPATVTPILTTIPNPTMDVIASTLVLKDSANLQGGENPTGKITFELFLGATLVHTEIVAVNGNGIYSTPLGFRFSGNPAAIAGNYSWTAVYSGDANNASVSDSNPIDEQVTVAKASPMLTSAPEPDTFVLGTPAAVLKDAATLSNGYKPTGTITFNLSLGATVVDTETITVNGINGVYRTPTGFSPTAVGIYQWTAQYSGDANNSPLSDSNPRTEQVKVYPAANLTLTSAPEPDTFVLGTPSAVLKDAATLSGGNKPTGTITFKLSLGATVVDTETVSVNGNGVYRTPTGFSPTTTGIYQWTAQYSGDAHNSPLSDSNPRTEQVKVYPAANLTLTSAPEPDTFILGTPSAVLKDAATLSNGFRPTGTITFKLSLGAAVVDTETITVNGNGVYTTPTGFSPTAVGIYQWTAQYSGDLNNLPVSDSNPRTEVLV
jgi:hypothetical protein